MATYTSNDISLSMLEQSLVAYTLRVSACTTHEATQAAATATPFDRSTMTLRLGDSIYVTQQVTPPPLDGKPRLPVVTQNRYYKVRVTL